MKKLVMTAAVTVALLASAPMAALATPADDLKAFQDFYLKRFPDVPFAEYKNGVYAINEDARMSWQSIEEFPPYEEELEKGKELFETPFANGKSYAGCFPNGGIGIRQNYPYFDAKTGQVKTLEHEINECRVKNGEKPLKYKKGPLAEISAYMASTSNGKKFDIKVPNDPRALAAYESGKWQFYAKRGQLSVSCANCHKDNAGMWLRGDLLGPALGHPSHWPAYRLKWGAIGTLQRRFTGCNKQVRAKPMKAQSKDYTALEYFLTYMSNGIEVNAPSSRK